jgi:hypothetical protein
MNSFHHSTDNNEMYFLSYHQMLFAEFELYATSLIISEEKAILQTVNLQKEHHSKVPSKELQHFTCFYLY